jgi:hypothetical protein
MKIDLPLSDGIVLQIASGTNGGTTYPTDRIQKGLVLFCEGQDLSEEAVGFGVPIFKRGLQTIFPSEVELYLHEGSSPKKIRARYKLNLEEKIARSGAGTINNHLVYASKNVLAALIRRLPIIRKLLTSTSNLLRSFLRLKTTYEPGGFSTYVTLTYGIDADTDRVLVELIGQDLIPDSISEIIVMNEQGAHFFDQYQEAGGIYKQGNAIGCWDEVEAANAAFLSSRQHISFSLPQVKGAKLYRGRELIGTRLAWSGFGYSLPPSQKLFKYEISIKRLP